LEDAGGFFFLSSMPVVSSSCPGLFRVKTGVRTAIFWSLEHVLRETRFTVNWLACRRLEGHHSSLAAVGAFDFEHSFLGRVGSPLLGLSIIEKFGFPIIINCKAHGRLKGFHEFARIWSFN